MYKQLTAMIGLSIAIILLLTLPALNREKVMETPAEDQATETLDAGTSAEEARQTDIPAASPKPTETAPALIAAAVQNPDGSFRLTLEDAGDTVTMVLEEDVFGDFAVHLVARDYSSDSEAGPIYFDLVLVRPEQGEVRSFPLYSFIKDDNDYYTDLYAGHHQLKIIDERTALFVQRAVRDHSLHHMVSYLDLESGSVYATPSFWTVAMGSEEHEEDFLMGSEYAFDDKGRVTKAMLSSYLGKMWHIDLQSRKVTSKGGQPYPAIGDPGSSPPRTMLYPTPDLERFIYRFPQSNYFMLADTMSGVAQGVFGAEEGMTAADPGPVWNPEGTSFFLEYAAKGNEKATYFDTGYAVAAEAIAFYDRDGKLIRVLKSSSEERMSVYNWLDEHRLLLEFYKPALNRQPNWSKEGITYKEYDIRSGKLSAYRYERNASRLAEPRMLPLQKEGATFYSKAAVLLDEKNKRIWEPGLYGRAYTGADGRLFIDAWSGDLSIIYQWNEQRKRLEIVASRDHLRAVAGDWLVLEEQESHSILYRHADAAAPLNEDGLAMLPSELAQPAESGDWWNGPSSTVETIDEKPIRAEGKSRYGTLRVRSVGGEKHVPSGGNLRLYGSYAVEYVNPSGKMTELPKLEHLELEQADQIADIRVLPFEGYDVLMYQPEQFEFSLGYDGGVKRTFAYMITEQGEAFPLTFRYATASGAQDADAIGFFDQIPIQAEHGRMVAHGYAGERFYELSWTPDMDRKQLTLTAAKDRTEESEGLKGIVGPYSLWLAQALGLSEFGMPDGPMNEERLRGLFTEQAWRNPGFQRLLKDFEEQAKAGNPSRAFPWEPINARFDEHGNIRVTFTFNLFYAVGWAAHLEAVLKYNGYEWIFHDFGALTTEYAESVEEADEDPMKPYNGLHIQDPLDI
ncbi:hypothetical protein [Paenibacillus soyae]|uniref:Uncharacterized protein n=1 Tax=Paenibacillus soyae TaxID=2969249 RepID=A0A9X2S7N4_9BACL|nr:hypothetical protein [Paenibacillus soyae]MCR2803524.1 hypothetical protein [Paenibacillus soyae]